MADVKRITLTQERLKELLHYDSDSGIFTWRVRSHGRGGAINPGDTAGFKNGRYMRIGIDAIKYNVHRIAWYYVHGEWPKNGIDHRDGDTGNNAIKNLRLATHAQNNQNKRQAYRSNKSGFLGVSKLKGKWRAQIKVDGRDIYLGLFDTPEHAHDVYLVAKVKYHPFQTLQENSHGRARTDPGAERPEERA